MKYMMVLNFVSLWNFYLLFVYASAFINFEADVFARLLW